MQAAAGGGVTRPGGSPDDVPRDADGVAAWLARSGRGARQRLIGIELELAVLRDSDLRPATYEGPQGIEALLRRLERDGGQAPIEEAGRLIGLRRGSGEALTLEPGGQLELSTAPAGGLGALAARVAARTHELAAAADELGLVLAGGGLVPSPPEESPWMPKERYRIMRAYFAALGEPARLATTMMQRTLSVQATVDFADGPDALDTLQLGFLAAPVATAIFAASPIEGWREAGTASRRAVAWRATDPARSGEVAACLAPGATLRAYADFVLDAPVMFRVAGSAYVPCHGLSFRRVLEAGRWPDGAPVTHDDLRVQLGGVFPDARLKPGVIELRSTDGQAQGDVPAVAAFWVGLLYDRDARAQARELLAGLDAAERDAARDAAARLGLGGRFGRRDLAGVARDLLAIARAGLARREAAGLEDAGAAGLLARVEARVERGKTLADELLESWRGPWAGEPRRLVEALRLR